MLLNCGLVLASAALATALPHRALYARVVDSATAANTTYDFIIAGGGTSGLTVADRLTENANVNVLVIENGPFDNGEDGVLVPGAYFPVPYLWLPLMSTPQTALNNGVFLVPTGRGVGGGSMANAMFFHRSGAAEYNGWQALGANGWDWDGLLPYFKKSETFHAPNAAYAAEHNITWDSSAHGSSGPIQSSYAPYDYPGGANFWNAAKRLGFPTVQDPNAGTAIGVFRLLRSVDPSTQTRSYSKTAHYDRVQVRPNYHILPMTSVGKVLFSETTATGVEFIERATNIKRTALATREVILAAGAVHTPQILQLSGIGLPSHLAKLKISPLVNLPGVGQNLQDHLVLTVNYNFTNNLFPNGGSLDANATYDAEQRALYNAGQPSAYDLTRTTGNHIIFLSMGTTFTSAKASTVIGQAVARNPSSAFATSPHPHVLHGYTKAKAVLLALLHGGEAIGDISWNTGPATTIYMTRPFSRGSVLVTSLDPLADPAIDFGAGLDPTDIDFLVAIYKKNRELMATPEIAVLGPIETSPAPGLDATDAQIRAALKAAVQPSNAHECCTAAMRPEEDGGVVDARLRVYGTQRLSVVDASIWPFVTGGAPQATVYGGAEKAADIIKARNGL